MRLEPYEGKLSRTVLRRERRSNPPDPADRLIQEASLGAVVALVNGLFNTDFPLDSPVSFPNKESVTETLRQIVSDMILLIAGEFFLIEAQIDDDLNLALRLFIHQPVEFCPSSDYAFFSNSKGRGKTPSRL